MKLAVVAGGWHWPLDFFRKIARETPGADLFAIAHRNPELRIVNQEKVEILTDPILKRCTGEPDSSTGLLAALDWLLYMQIATLRDLKHLGWRYTEEPNICGDWQFLNQWLSENDYRKYDVILSCHDDTFILEPGVFDQLAGDWLLLANGRYPQAPPAYVRGSFEFWKPELLDMLGGRIDLGPITLTRDGKTDSPAGLNALSEWNNTGVPLREFMVKNGLADRVQYLSPYYRISRWAIEAERGFLHYKDGAPWSFEEGVKEYLGESVAA